MTEHCHECDELVDIEIHEFGGREQKYCEQCGVRLGYA